ARRVLPRPGRTILRGNNSPLAGTACRGGLPKTVAQYRKSEAPPVRGAGRTGLLGGRPRPEGRWGYASAAPRERPTHTWRPCQTALCQPVKTAVTVRFPFRAVTTTSSGTPSPLLSPTLTPMYLNAGFWNGELNWLFRAPVSAKRTCTMSFVFFFTLTGTR